MNPIRHILTAEIDTHIREGEYILRLYSAENSSDSRKMLMSMQGVFNVACDLQNLELTPENPSFCGWGLSDAMLLRRLLPILRGRSVYEMRHAEIIINEKQFQRLRELFADDLDRFINRDDQRPLPPPGQNVPLREHFIIRLHDARNGIYHIAAELEFSDGTRKPFHQLLNSFGQGAAAKLTRSELFKAVLPVPLSRLGQYFSKPTTIIRREKILQVLPELLNHHLELLDAGPDVIKCNATGRTQNSRCVACFSTQESFFCIKLLCNGLPMSLNPPSKSACMQSRICILKTGKIVIEKTELPSCIHQAITKLRLFCDDNQGEVTFENVLKVKQGMKTASALRALWKAFPPEIKCTFSPEVEGLFTESSAQHPVLTAKLDVKDINHGNLLEFDAKWQMGGTTLLPDELDAIIQNRSSVFRDSRGHWLALPDSDSILELRERMLAEGILNEDGTPAIFLRTHAHEKLTSLQHSCPELRTSSESRPLILNILREVPCHVPEIPSTLLSTLRPYQRQGAEFIIDRTACQTGALLADEMGLGKTLQALSALSAWFHDAIGRRRTFHGLVICPTSVISVWMNQAKLFCPDLPFTAYSGPPENRNMLRREILVEERNYIAVTSYSLLRQDFQYLQEISFDLVILDEAQFIKTPKALTTRYACQLNASHRLALTGTPMENHLLDCCSIMNFLNPGLLGTTEECAAYYQNHYDASRLNARIRPLYLRRRKRDVATELPPRTVAILPVELTEPQRTFYNQTLMACHEAIKAAGPIEILASITRLRQIACDAELLLKHPHDLGNGKLQVLLEKCHELNETGHSVIVFSQFTQMLDIIARHLTDARLPWLCITGQTPADKRRTTVEQFNNPDTPPTILLLSLKAGGLGLTLTRADYVFIYDPWWNPAAENQAIDRTHRIGQTKPVFAYKMVAENTIEEQIIKLMAEKQRLFDALLENDCEEDIFRKMTADDLRKLLSS